jgi:2-dehydropantoate 2-reductase
MKVCVFGAGAIGGHLAARLFDGGADVSVVVRGAHLEAIRARGLTVRTPAGETVARIPASDDPAALGPQDAVIVATKAPSLGSVALGIGPLLRADTPVVFVMNGVPWWYFYKHGGPYDGRQMPKLDPDGALWNELGPQRAIGGVVNSPSVVAEPGVVQVERANNWLILGEPDGSLSERVERIAAPLCSESLDVRVTDDIRTAIWEKLISNLMTGPIAVLTQSSYDKFFVEPAVVAAARQIVVETVAVAQALGCQPSLDHDKRLAASINSKHRASILQDLDLGRPMEVDAIFGMAVEMARLAGVPTPTLDLLVALAKVRARRAGLYES